MTFSPPPCGEGLGVGATGHHRAPQRANRIAAPVAKAVANRVVGITAAGSCEPAAARKAITWVGSKVTFAVLIARNSTIASVAVPFIGLSRSSSRMARTPKGVAAFDRPSILAATFITMAPIAGSSGGTCGKRRWSSGRSRRARAANKPAASAILSRPWNSAIAPIRPMPKVTASCADWARAVPSASMPPAAGSASAFQAATATETRMMTRKAMFIPDPRRRRSLRGP